MYRIVKFALTGLFAVGMVMAAGALQRGEGQQVQKGPANVTGAKTGIQPGSTYTGINQSPWFGNQDIRQQLKFNDQQYNQLNQAYGQAWQNYQQGMNTLGKNLTDDQRAQKQQQLQMDFYKNFSAAADKAITDPQQRQRFNQMYWQYRGYGAFNDPTIQGKLNLTPEQRQKLTQYGSEWNKQMSDLSRTYQTDQTGALKSYNAMRSQYDTQLNSVLTPQQQQTWRQMVGQPYNFTPSAYFQSSSANNTNPGTNPNPNPNPNNKK